MKIALNHYGWGGGTHIPLSCSCVDQVMQQAGIEGREAVMLLEDHQLLDPVFLELVNSLLSAGEVPGLYTPEELEPLLSPLKDEASQEGFRGSLFSYFSQRVRSRLHFVLIMDSSSPEFSVHCEANPALYTRCSFQSMECWSQRSMLEIPRMFLGGLLGARVLRTLEEARPMTGGKDLARGFLQVHTSCLPDGATPRHYVSLLHTYQDVYSTKKKGILKRQAHLQAGLTKLNEAATLVDQLKRKAAEQKVLLAQKQEEADAALNEITASMQQASEQRSQMEVLKQQQSQERAKLEKRKKAIDIELSEIEPLVQETRQAVGSIKPETLSEIRALRAPPDVIRDILEGVLRIMGVFDTSWGSMRSFLARRGVKEDIQNFDARKISPEIRESVQELLQRNGKSFESAVAKRASTIALPLASWVKANVRFSYVLEKIGPLEKEQSVLQENLSHSEARLAKLVRVLEALDRKVSDMRMRFEQRTTEAAKLKMEVEKEEETIAAAGNLVGKLEDERERWSGQVGTLSKELEQLPKRALMAAGFVCYLSQAPEDQRRERLNSWMAALELESFDFRRFLSTESEQLVWKSEGLPSDDLSVENALVILHNQRCPFLVDPSQRATEWLKTHLKESRLESVRQQDANFTTTLELAVRFGKTLVVQEADGVEPLLFPLLRRELVSQGPRYVVQIGDKMVDYNESFSLFLSTRNPQPEIPPDAAAIVTKVNFSTTKAGLVSQLLGATILHERPELEQRKTDLLRTEEEMKVQLAGLEESLLQELATAEGNILENKVLLQSLNETKAKSSTIAASLHESHQLQASLDQERDSYLPLATFGSNLFFVIGDLSKLNRMYQFSLSSFLSLFQRALESKEDLGNTELRIQALVSTLQALVYEHTCRSLFKDARLMFALHLVRGMHPRQFQESEWEAFTGQLVQEVRRQESLKQIKSSLPAWCDLEHAQAISSLKNNFPALYDKLQLNSEEAWKAFSRSPHCEREFPVFVQKKLTSFQQLLVLQALRPDRLQTAMEGFAMQTLGLKQLAPAALNLKRLCQLESLPTEPILIIISPGADPSQELQEMAEDTVGAEHYHQVAMGQGQAGPALRLLQDCALNGDWLCLKNLHLVTSWLPVLEKELNSLQPHRNFRLWLTTEVHLKFPAVLLQSSLKVTYEAPPSIKRNMQRTYETWSPEYISQGNSVVRSQALFALSWFHSIVQERRQYIPQGWSKFYEFTNADMRAAASIIDRLCSAQSGEIVMYLH